MAGAVGVSVPAPAFVLMEISYTATVTEVSVLVTGR
jgi:hypothetical protein